MIKTVVTVPIGEILPDAVISAYFFLSQANAFCQAQGRAPVFELTLAGIRRSNWLYEGHFGIRATPYQEIPAEVDLLIIPGFLGERIPLEENQWLVQWVGNQYREHGTEVASMCTGAFVLAAAGLLDGKKCTTHWAFRQDFMRLFPAARLQTEKIITDQDGIYTSAGAYSSLNLLLYLVEKFAGKDTAVWLSRVFQVDTRRNSQLPFMMLNQLFQHEDTPIKRVQEYVEKNFAEELRISGLAEQFAMSPRTLVRRFKKATGLSPLEYLQQVRMEAAKRMLEQENKNVEEVIFDSGYRDGPTFRQVFKRSTGLTPSEYRRQYKRY